MIETERTGTHDGGTNGFRRFSDKIMWASFALVLALVGTVWGITWLATRDHVQEVDGIQRSHGERIKALEENSQEVRRSFDKVDRKQDQLDAKIDYIIREMKK